MRARIDPAERGTTAQIAEAALEWLQQDEDLLDTFLYEHLLAITSEMVRAEMLATRQTKRWKEMLDEPEEARRARLQQWFDRMEHVSPEAGYVRLGAITMEELLTGARERETRIVRDATGARWFRMLASGMRPGQTVEEAYTPRQVEQAYESAQEVVVSRLDSIMAGAKEALDRILNPDDGQPTAAPNGPTPSGPTK
jgi:hypothetical protein